MPPPDGRRPGHDRPRQRPDHDQPRRGRRRRARADRAARWASPTARCSATSATRSATTTGTGWSRTRAGSRRSASCSATSARTTPRRCKRHYANGPARRLAGATSSAPTPAAHPWEDFAETWAHYLHIVDTLETARGLRPQRPPAAARTGGELAAEVDFDRLRAGDRARSSTPGCR